MASALFTSTNHPCKLLALEYTDITSPFSIIRPIADDAKRRTGRRAPRTSKDWRASSHFLCQSCMVSCKAPWKHTIQHHYYSVWHPIITQIGADHLACLFPIFFSLLTFFVWFVEWMGWSITTSFLTSQANNNQYMREEWVDSIRIWNTLEYETLRSWNDQPCVTYIYLYWWMKWIEASTIPIIVFSQIPPKFMEWTHDATSHMIPRTKHTHTPEESKSKLLDWISVPLSTKLGATS